MSVFKSIKNSPDMLSWPTLIQMTRPGFLAITAVACLLGTSVSIQSGVVVNSTKAVAALVLAMLMHAAANVINDYHDAVNGADEANVNGLFPFTGGARLIQNGQVSLSQTHLLAKTLLLFLIPCGALLAFNVGSGLIWLGLVGIVLGWGYSAPPLALMTRGLGEIAVAFAWGLVVVGADYVQRGQFAIAPWTVAFSFAALVGNILLINGFPDAPADASVGKRTLVVRLGPMWAAWLYLCVALFAHVWALSKVSLWTLLSLPLSVTAFVWLTKYATHTARLAPAIVLTICAAVLHGVVLSVFLFYSLPTSTL